MDTIRFQRFFLCLASGLLCGVFSLAQSPYLDSCLRALPHQKDDTNKVYLLNQIAWDISYTDLAEGLSYVVKADSLAQKLHFERSLAEIDNTYGAIYMDMGMHDDAYARFMQGMRLAEKYHLDHEKANLLSNLGILQQRRRDYRKAVHSYVEALGILLKNKDSVRLFGIMNNLASAYYEEKNLDSAMYFYKICMEHNARTHKDLSLAYNYLNVSDILSERRDFRKAMQYIDSATAIARRNNDNYVLSYSLGQKADILIAMKSFPLALTAAREALELARKSSDLELTKTCERKLSDIYEGLGDYQSSLQHYRLYTAAKDSMMSTENNKQIRQLETQYGTEKKERENKLLLAENRLNQGTIKHQRTITVFIAAGLLLALLLIFFVLRGYRQKQRANLLITQQKEEVEKQKVLVEQKSVMVQEKNKEILDSIHYAKRIQGAMLTSASFLKKVFPKHFILYRPKDIVSGDFYWSVKKDGKIYLAIADCTGHGVPGAFMSLVGIAFLNEIVLEKNITSPERILDALRDEIIHALNPEDAEVEERDGMDISLCCFDQQEMKLYYASANNSMYLLRDGDLMELRPDKFPVGKHQDHIAPFTLNSMMLRKGDMLYAFSDGYADQFGGPQGKKFKYKQLQQLLMSIHSMDEEAQRQKLDSALEQWRGSLEQIDDILIAGIRIV